jgi:hypothetical protein
LSPILRQMSKGRGAILAGNPTKWLLYWTSGLLAGAGRETLMAAVSKLSPVVGVQAARAVLAIPKASYYDVPTPDLSPVARSSGF